MEKYPSVEESAMETLTRRSHSLILQQFLADPRTKNMNRFDHKRIAVHVAVLVKRGKILAVATNRNGSRSSGSGYSDHSIHAERNVVKDLGDINRLKGCDMYIMRIKNNRKCLPYEEFMPSMPCRGCQIFLEKCIREYGLKNIYYTS
jgi:hypothetical protein